jgi:hypothetical protein
MHPVVAEVAPEAGDFLHGVECGMGEAKALIEGGSSAHLAQIL